MLKSASQFRDSTSHAIAQHSNSPLKYNAIRYQECTPMHPVTNKNSHIASIRVVNGTECNA